MLDQTKAHPDTTQLGAPMRACRREHDAWTSGGSCGRFRLVGRTVTASNLAWTGLTGRGKPPIDRSSIAGDLCNPNGGVELGSATPCAEAPKNRAVELLLKRLRLLSTLGEDRVQPPTRLCWPRMFHQEDT